MRKGAKTGLIRYTLFTLLILAAGGMVFMDVGGFFRGGVQRGDVARVGHEGITLSDFDRSLQAVLRQQGIGPDDAWRFGMVSQILSMEIRENLVAQAASDMGLRIGDQAVAARIADLVKPLATDDATPQEALNRLLRMQGMSEAQFVGAIRRDMTTGLLRGAFQAESLKIPDALARDLYAYEKEERSAAIVFLPDSDPGKAIPVPTEADLKGLYKASESLYAIPERRSFTLAWFGPDLARKDIVVSDEELRKIYDGDPEAYALPEMRTLAQVIVKTETEARAIVAEVKTGKTLENALKAVAGKKDAYQPPQDFAREGLFPAVADPVFSAKEKDIIGPVRTPLGWHVIVLEGIKAPRTQSFDEVREAIRKEEIDMRAGEKLSALSDSLDDRIAGGGTIEEAEKDFSLTLKTENLLDAQGLGEDGTAGLSDFEADRANILETVFSLMESETSPVIEISGGRHAVIRVDRVVASSVKPFESVREDLVKRWEAQQKKLANIARAKAFSESIKSGEKTLEQVAAQAGLKPDIISTLRREDAPPAPLSPSAVAAVFDASKGDTVLAEGVQGQVLARILDIRPGDPSKADPSEIRALAGKYEREGGEVDLASYLGHLHTSYGVVVNEPLLRQMYGPGRETP